MQRVVSSGDFALVERGSISQSWRNWFFADHPTLPICSSPPCILFCSRRSLGTAFSRGWTVGCKWVAKRVRRSTFPQGHQHYWMQPRDNNGLECLLHACLLFPLYQSVPGILTSLFCLDIAFPPPLKSHLWKKTPLSVYRLSVLLINIHPSTPRPAIGPLWHLLCCMDIFL